MPEKGSRISARSSTGVLSFAGRSSTQMEAEALLNEIDNLALLLEEVRKHTDRIEAAADAIGDAILSHSRMGELGFEIHAPASDRR